MEPGNPIVSIYCLTYNHEKYIRDCLDGFLMQKTDFPFEVIVHDDASSDGTQRILHEYEEKYPGIIRPIYQTENQVSLGINSVTKYIFPLVKGKYVAVCEGDDYWTDSHKLQSQIDLLEAHPECHFCVCGVQEVTSNKNPLGIYHPNVKIEGTTISSRSFIGYASTYSFQTSSYIMRYEDWKEYILNPPQFKTVSDIGDLPMLLYFGSLGEAAYVGRIMSCYRRGASTSYSSRKNNWTDEKRISHFERQTKVWKYFDEFSNGKYHDICIEKAAQNMFGDLILRGQTKEFLKKDNREYYDALTALKKGYILLSCILKKTMKRHYISTVVKNEQKERLLWENKLQE